MALVSRKEVGITLIFPRTEGRYAYLLDWHMMEMQQKEVYYLDDEIPPSRRNHHDLRCVECRRTAAGCLPSDKTGPIRREEKHRAHLSFTANTAGDW
jgi:hypothetical protein